MRTLFTLLLMAAPAFAADIPKPTPTDETEPKAKTFSLTKAGEYLDSAGVHWTRERKCVTCHTNMPYIMARPLVKSNSDGWKEVRTFLEKDVESWKTGKPKGDAYVVSTTVGLVFSDAATTGKLHDRTKESLAKMWSVQKPTGEWNWLKCEWPPMEHDDYYGAVLAAVTVGVAPGDYAKSDEAKAGLDKLKTYLKKTKAPDLHHKAMLLWAATKIDGLMTDAEKKETIAEVKKIQHADGGWCLPAFGKYKRRDKTENDVKQESDGYATGFAVYVLRQAGVAETDANITKGIAWLKSNQRESGRWYTRSLNNDKAHYIANAGTAFAVMALSACGENVAGK